MSDAAEGAPQGRRAAILSFALGSSPAAPDVDEELGDRFTKQMMDAYKKDDAKAFQRALDAYLGVRERRNAKRAKGNS
jgi:hypothetical protein